MFGAAVTVIILLFAVGLVREINIKRSEANLLAPQDWSHFPGAETTDRGIHIKPIGRVITHKDTSAAQPNPPVNIRGSHLKVSGDFQIETTISGVNNGATLQFYGQVPIIYDEWRQERGSIRVTITNSRVSLQIWDGTSPSSVDERIFKTSSKNDVEIVLSHKGDKVVIQVNNRVLGFIPDHNIFAQGTIWFGVDANLGTEGWTLNTLRARSLGKGQLKVASPPSGSKTNNQTDALRNLALANPRHIPIGASISVYPLFTDEQYRKTALGQFSMMTPENSMKPQFIHPQKNLYTYQEADGLVETALNNQMIVHGHALVLGKANPRWMEKTPKSERKQVMVNHISNVVGHFKGKVAEWDVVNEPLSEDDIDYSNGKLGLRKQMWSDAMGEDYIDIAFRSVHAADPAAKLYLNDFGLEKDGMRWDALVSLIQRLRERGVPIDGVGFESHVYHEPDIINPDVLRQHIQILAGLGIVSRISEIDILGDDQAVQTSQYANILKVCLSEPSCTSYNTWGVSDSYGSTTLSDRYPIRLGKSLLWDSNYVPKQAVSSLQEVLKKQ